MARKNPGLEPERWIERYSDYLYSFAYARLRKEEVAEDLVQDTFFSALRARDTFLHNASEKTWLISILKRKIIDYYRKKSTQNELNIFDKPAQGSDVHATIFLKTLLHMQATGRIWQPQKNGKKTLKHRSRATSFMTS